MLSYQQIELLKTENGYIKGKFLQAVEAIKLSLAEEKRELYDQDN
jgi:hypothetical protein